MNEADIQTVVERVVRDRLKGGHILRVESRREKDSDGDDVILITIIVDGPASDFEPHRLAGLARYLRSELTRFDEYGFPMVSFMSQSERDAVAA